MKEYKTHPSYGLAGFARWTGARTKMFGSPLPEHNTGVTLYVRRASVAHEYGQDWFGDEGLLVEVNFSPAQFAELLTTMNVGQGVPCTVEMVGGKQMPPPPADDPVEHEKIVDAFKENIRETGEKLRLSLARVRDLLAKKSLTKEDKREIEWMIGKAEQDVESNAPFMVEQFGQATSRMVTSARAEMAATVSVTMERLGMQKLGELQAAASQAPTLIEEAKPGDEYCSKCRCHKSPTHRCS